MSFEYGHWNMNVMLPLIVVLVREKDYLYVAIDEWPKYIENKISFKYSFKVLRKLKL